MIIPHGLHAELWLLGSHMMALQTQALNLPVGNDALRSEKTKEGASKIWHSLTSDLVCCVGILQDQQADCHTEPSLDVSAAAVAALL